MAAILTPQATLATLMQRPWGGDTLSRERRELAAEQGEPLTTELPIGESWDFSTLDVAESLVSGRPLREVLGGTLPFLAKRIDSARPLSLQVHPDDQDLGAQMRMGKEEAWIILRAEPGAHAFVGLKPGIDVGQLAAALDTADRNPSAQADASWQSCLHRVPMTVGSIVLVPAGTVHAVSGGLLLAEIQQPVDRTFRFFDYGSQRKIHRAAAFKALKPGAQAQVWSPSPGHPSRVPRVARLRGKHLELQPLGPGAHRIPATQVPRLLVQVQGTSTVSASEDDAPIETMHATQLRLGTGPALDINVANGGLVVIAGMVGQV